MLRLKFERTSRQLTQRTVGVVAHVPQPTVSAIERGRLIPTPEQLQRLAAVFGVAPDDLLTVVVQP